MYLVTFHHCWKVNENKAVKYLINIILLQNEPDIKNVRWFYDSEQMFFFLLIISFYAHNTQPHMENPVYDTGSEIVSPSRLETGVHRQLHPSWAASWMQLSHSTKPPHSKYFHFTRAQGPLDPLWLWICCAWAWMLSTVPSFTHTSPCVNIEGPVQQQHGAVLFL